MLQKIRNWSQRLNGLNELVVGVLMALLVLDVWVGVLDRYLIHWQLSWVEELARYIMIWAILLAVPCAVCSRAHIGLDLLTRKFNPTGQRMALFIADLAMILFFLYIAYSGVTFAAKGLVQLSTVFGLQMAFPYAAIPVAFSLAALQTFVLMMTDAVPDTHEGAN